jgi:type I restriction enzyme S subunit
LLKMKDNNEKPYDIPDTWEWKKLGDICTIYSGSTPSTKDDTNFNGDIPWITPSDLSEHIEMYIRRGKRNISKKGLNSSSAVMIPSGSVLLSSRAPIGYVAIAANDVTTNQGMKSFHPFSGIFNEYLYYYLKGNKPLLESYGSGTTFIEVSKTRVSQVPIPIPPFSEQEHIVEKIEELFTQLDAGVAELRTAKAQLQRYRQAVLKSAVEGELTREWREEHKDKLEPADVLLERILAERKSKWEEAELTGRYQEPITYKSENSIELPDNWVWANLDMLTYHITSGSRGWAKYYSDEGAIFIRAQDINTDSLLLDGVARVSLPENVEGKRTRVFQGDLLITITGANVTKTAIVRQQLDEAFVSQHVGLVRPIDSKISEFLYYWIISPANGRRVLKENAYGAGKPGLNLTNLRELPVALPPIGEQARIVQMVRRRLSVADEIDRQLDQSLTRAERLRQSILKWAFEGKLVEQDIEDESVLELIERI